MKIIKIIFLNLRTIFLIAGIFILLPIILQKSFDLVQLLNISNKDNILLSTNVKIDNRYKLINYKDIDWAQQFYIDTIKKKYAYYDFVTYKPNKFSSETINIDKEGFRNTHGSTLEDLHDIWIFGGSTLYGFGANDETTIPSELAKLTNLKIRNYGVEGWVSRQELNQLIHEYAKLTDAEIFKKRTVIFYDGANDGLDHCRKEMNQDISTDRQNQINDALDQYGLISSKSNLEFRYIFYPALDIFNKIKYKLGFVETALEKDKWFICDTNLDRANQIAKAVAKDWKYAQKIAEINGDEFLAILQPHAVFIDTSLDYLYDVDSYVKINQERSKNLEVMYPLFRKYAKEFDVNFLDLTNILNGEEQVYIDHAHLVPKGNKIVAQGIKFFLEK
tara:strand:- start:2332 stop:3501 length:1170 start_codon:yes stop_codon:yes gene_type:complete